MSLLNTVFVYMLIWWLMLFTVLPLGVKRHKEDGKGFDMGAPEKPDLKKKLLINSFLSAVIVLVIQALVINGVLDWHALFRGALE